MKKLMLSTLIVIFCICLAPIQSLACTTFVLNKWGKPIYGKNMDWPVSVSAYVLVNKRGVTKMTIAQPPYVAATWTSKYGSITFNWFAREFPFEGINEAGLFVSAMGLSETEHPEQDSRPAFDPHRWIQYQLDNFSTVHEVIASDKDISIPKIGSQEQATLHYLVSDKTGNCASIEFIKGKLVCHTGWTMPVKVLANSTYDQSIAYFWQQRLKNLFSPIPIPEDNRPSLDRFAVAVDRVKRYRPWRSEPAVDYAFQILEDVEINPIAHSAAWSAVYDYTNKRIYFRSWNHDQIRWFDFSAFDFSCTTPVTVLDTSADLSGDVTNSFVDYTEDINREILESAARFFPVLNTNMDFFATFPETYTHCTE
jgi:choloylglycine hydrolase